MWRLTRLLRCHGCSVVGAVVGMAWLLRCHCGGGGGMVVVVFVGILEKVVVR